MKLKLKEANRGFGVVHHGQIAIVGLEESGIVVVRKPEKPGEMYVYAEGNSLELTHEQGEVELLWSVDALMVET